MDKQKKPVPGCSKCAREACLWQRYSNTFLCSAHFCSMFEDRVRKSVREFSMLKPHEHVAVALSGGKDSVVLMHMLHRLSKRLPMRLSAILVDEGIAGYRKHSVLTARRECGKLGIRLHITSFRKEFGRTLDSVLRIRKKGGAAQKGACTYCGVFRRALLNRTAKKIGADKLAVGHNLDDAAQTVLMNLMRNEPGRLARFGISGGIAEGNGLVPRIKPLIRCPEKEIALWALLHGIRIHYMQCPYAHEALRQEVRRCINSLEEKFPGTKFGMLNSYLSLRPAIAGMAKKEAKKNGGRIPECPACGGASSGGQCGACRLADGIKKQGKNHLPF